MYTGLHCATRVNDDTRLNNNVVGPIFSHQQGRKRLENAQDFFVKTKIKTKTFISRPRPRLVSLSLRRLETKTLVSRTTSLVVTSMCLVYVCNDSEELSLQHYTNSVYYITYYTFTVLQVQHRHGATCCAVVTNLVFTTIGLLFLFALPNTNHL